METRDLDSYIAGYEDSQEVNEEELKKDEKINLYSHAIEELIDVLNNPKTYKPEEAVKYSIAIISDLKEELGNV